MPAQEGADVLAGEFEQIQCVRPVEETQPPPQDPRQRQVGLDIEKKLAYFLLSDRSRANLKHNKIYFNSQHCSLLQGGREQNMLSRMNDAVLARIMTRLQSLEEQLGEIEAQLRSLQVCNLQKKNKNEKNNNNNDVN